MTGSDEAAWLDGPAARTLTCDASVIPVVTGDIDPTVLDDLVDLCVQLDRLDHKAAPPAHDDSSNQPDPQPGGGQAREMLQHAIIGKTTVLLPHS